MKTRFLRDIEVSEVGMELNLNYVLHFFSSGFISTVYEWLKKQDRTPEEIAEVLLHLITQLRI